MLGSNRSVARPYQGALVKNQSPRKREVKRSSADEPPSNIDLTIPTLLTLAGPNYVGRPVAQTVISSLLPMSEGRLTSLPERWSTLRDDMWVHLRRDGHIIFSIFQGHQMQISTYACAYDDVRSALLAATGIAMEGDITNVSAAS